MMQRIVALALVLGLATPAFAEGPIAPAARKAAAAAAQSSSNGNGGGGSKGMMWGGVAMIAAGGTLAALGATALKNETCGAALIGFSIIGGCVEETNKALLWTGVGIAAGGATLVGLGANRSVQVGPGRVSYKLRF